MITNKYIFYSANYNFNKKCCLDMESDVRGQVQYIYSQHASYKKGIQYEYIEWQLHVAIHD